MTTDMRNTLNFIAEGTVDFQRTVAVSWCSYSHIIQLRDWLPDAIGGVAWFSFDNPAESPRIPIFAGATELPSGFEFCGQKRYREDAALWQFRKANKLATVNWGKTSKTISEGVNTFETKAMEDLFLLEKQVQELIEKDEQKEAQSKLNTYSKSFYGATVQRWKELEQHFWELFGRGF